MLFEVVVSIVMLVVVEYMLSVREVAAVEVVIMV